MSDMLVRCDGSYVVSVSGSGIVVVGGAGGEHLNDVQVFDGESHTWHRGTLPFSSLTVQCDLVFDSLSVTSEQALNLEMKHESRQSKNYGTNTELAELQPPSSSKSQRQIHLTHP